MQLSEPLEQAADRIYSKHLFCCFIPILRQIQFKQKKTLSSELVKEQNHVAFQQQLTPKCQQQQKSRLNCGVPKLLPMAVPFYGKPWKCSFLSINDTLLATKASLATWNGAWRLLLRESCRMRRRVWGSLNVFFRRLRDWPYSSSCSQRTS
mgnify:CR=1 FL=1